MAEYIKREDAINLLWLYADESCASVVSDFESLPAVPVVRCCECIYRDGTPGQPNILCGQMHDDDFCSYGQRKEADYVRDN